MKNQIIVMVLAVLLVRPIVAFSEGALDDLKRVSPNEWEFYGQGLKYENETCFSAPPWLIKSWESLARESVKDFDLDSPGIERLNKYFDETKDRTMIPYQAALPERLRALKWGVVHNGEVVGTKALYLKGWVSYFLGEVVKDVAAPYFYPGEICLGLKSKPSELNDSRDFAFVLTDGVTFEPVPVENIGYDVKFSSGNSEFKVETSTRKVQPVKSFMFKDNLSRKFLFVHWNEFWDCVPITEVFKVEGKEGTPVASAGGGCD